MRCVIVMIVLATMPPSSLDAQALGFRVGLTSSGVAWLRAPVSPCEGACFGNGYSNTDRRSLTVSGILRYSPHTWWAGETGLRIVPKGFEVTGPTFHMLYAEAPVLGVLQTGPGAGFFLEGGLVVGLRIACRRFMDTVTGLHEDDCGRVVTSYGRRLEGLRRWDASWELGLGGRISLPRGRLIASIHGQRSLIDIQPEDTREKMVNRVFVFTVGYEWDRGESR